MEYVQFAMQIAKYAQPIIIRIVQNVLLHIIYNWLQILPLAYRPALRQMVIIKMILPENVKLAILIVKLALVELLIAALHVLLDIFIFRMINYAFTVFLLA